VKPFQKIVVAFTANKNEDESAPDGVVTVFSPKVNEISTIILLEVKNEIGTGSSDPTSGVIDPLTPFIPIIQSHEQKYLQMVARLFESLHLAAEWLKVFYKNLMPSNDQWLYPFPNQYLNKEIIVSFLYNNWFTEDHNRFIWKATTDDRHLIIIQFSPHYNTLAHKLCANKGLAPRLLHKCTKIINGWCMVVVEYTEGMYLNLHNGCILIQSVDNKIRGLLFDFSLCGEHQKRSYPFSFNHKINRPSGAEPYGLLDKSHDLYYLGMLQKKEDIH
ncbi:9869_t:CDS:2, partial [Gigaspora margarita]